MSSERFERRLVFFIGKGGVGKSCLSAAAALAQARRGRRTLLVELAGTGKGHTFFGLEHETGYEPRRLMKGLPLYSCRITSKDALEEYGLIKLKLKALYRVVFENDFMRRLIDMVPGMTELLVIGRVWYLAEQKERNGRPTWDRIVVDSPATGHGLGMLRLPQVIMDSVSAGTFADDTRPILELLHDRRRTVVHLVCLPEELPVRETHELAESVKSELDMDVGACFLNKLWPDPFTDHEEKLLRRFMAAVRGEHAGVDGLLDRAISVARRQAQQHRYEKRLAAGLPGIPVIEIPYLFHDRIGPEQLDVLSYHMGKEPHA
jgi:anion-transporting  ArsA/GET3 family ATPase